MTNAILIGKHIYSFLKNDATISGLCGNRIYAVVAEQGTNYPFIVYYRSTVQSNNFTKDGFNEDSVEFSVIAVSDKYNTSVDIANQIRKVLEKRRLDCSDMIISNVRLVDIDESWSDNAYIQTLNFTCTVN